MGIVELSIAFVAVVFSTFVVFKIWSRGEKKYIRSNYDDVDEDPWVYCQDAGGSDEEVEEVDEEDSLLADAEDLHDQWVLETSRYEAEFSGDESEEEGYEEEAGGAIEDGEEDDGAPLNLDQDEDGGYDSVGEEEEEEDEEDDDDTSGTRRTTRSNSPNLRKLHRRQWSHTFVDGSHIGQREGRLHRVSPYKQTKIIK